jgi:hypothetical protein
MKQCCICNEFKDESCFIKNKHSPDGLLKKCKPCLRIYVKALKDGIKLSDEEKTNILKTARLTGLINIKENTNKMLKVIGYEPDSLLSIHEQFLIKHPHILK